MHWYVRSVCLALHQPCAAIQTTAWRRSMTIQTSTHARTRTHARVIHVHVHKTPMRHLNQHTNNPYCNILSTSDDHRKSFHDLSVTNSKRLLAQRFTQRVILGETVHLLATWACELLRDRSHTSETRMTYLTTSSCRNCQTLTAPLSSTDIRLPLLRPAIVVCAFEPRRILYGAAFFIFCGCLGRATGM